MQKLCYILSMQKLFEGALTPLQFGLIMIAILALGAILFFLTGFIKVKKGRVAIIERIGNFIGIYKPGIYYFFPLLYRRVGMYKVGEFKEIYEIDRIQYQVTYEIVDIKKYHYVGKHDMYGIIKASLKDSKDNLSEAIIRRSELVGVRFVKLEKLKTKH